MKRVYFPIVLLFISLSFFIFKADGNNRISFSVENENEARETWETVIDAKGGREKLSKVTSCFVLGQKYSDLYVFPNKFLSWHDMRPSEFQIQVSMENSQDNIGFYLRGNMTAPEAEVPSSKGNAQLKYLQRQLFLITKWQEPTPKRVYLKSLNGMNYKVIILQDSSDLEFGYYIDPKTNLPIRYFFLGGNPIKELSTIDFRDYQENQGILMPTKFSFDGSPWFSETIIINPDYDPEAFRRPPTRQGGRFQGLKKGFTPPEPVQPAATQFDDKQVNDLLSNLASDDRVTVSAARRDLISGGRDLAPRVLPSLRQGTLEFRFRVAEVLLSLERGQPDAVGFLKKVFLDPRTPELMRRESAFGIASNDSDWGFLLSHLNNPEVQIRRAILFVLDDATERADIPKDILEALPQIQKLRKDRDGLVSGLAREVSEQIERCRKSNPR